MWQWVKDDALVKAWSAVSRLEALLLVIMVVLYSVRHSWKFAAEHFDFFSKEWLPEIEKIYVSPFMWGAWVFMAGLLFAHLWNNQWHASVKVCWWEGRMFFKNIMPGARAVNVWIYVLLAASIIVLGVVIAVSPDAWPAITRPIRNMATGVSGWKPVRGLLKEEFLYRFVLYYATHRLLGRTPAFLGTVTLFSLYHHANSFYYPFAVAPAAIVFSIVALRSGSIIPALVVHAVFNTTIYFILALFSSF